ncbi:hypothetical protein NKH77_27560 [Streptomyces sp. M19]
MGERACRVRDPGQGTVGECFRTAFGGLRITVNPAETVLHGPGLDQAGLYGVLDRIQSLGLELVEVRRLPRAYG